MLVLMYYVSRAAPTWSSIEPDGRWKVLFYRAKDIFQPVIGHSFYNSTTGDLEVWVMSDLWSPFSGTAKLSWMDWNGKPLSGSRKPVSKTIPFTVGAINSTLVFKTNLRHDYLDLDLSNTLLRVNISDDGVTSNESPKKTNAHTSFFHPESLAKAKIEDPELQVSRSAEGHNFRVEANGGVAAWVWLDHPLGVQGYFSDNGFWLTPGESKNVQFTVKMDWTNGEWAGGVLVRSIWNNTLTN
jgi:beta-mannosidase